MASTLVAMASTLVAMASTLAAMASTLGDDLIPGSDDLHPSSDELHPSSDGLQLDTGPRSTPVLQQNAWGPGTKSLGVVWALASAAKSPSLTGRPAGALALTEIQRDS